jgi:hypothetical protein
LGSERYWSWQSPLALMAVELFRQCNDRYQIVIITVTINAT